jgi:hypothetical protein
MRQKWPAKEQFDFVNLDFAALTFLVALRQQFTKDKVYNVLVVINTIQRKLKIEHHEFHKQAGISSGPPEG